MKNGIDFVYEYSDLNLLQTRVKILTGEYAEIVLEFAGSNLAQWEDKNLFTFNYTLYEVPNKFSGPKLRTDKQFNEFLAYLLVDVIAARKTDEQEQNKLFDALNETNRLNIQIDDKYYPNNHRKFIKQPQTNLKSF